MRAWDLVGAVVVIPVFHGVKFRVLSGKFFYSVCGWIIVDYI